MNEWEELKRNRKRLLNLVWTKQLRKAQTSIASRSCVWSEDCNVLGVLGFPKSLAEHIGFTEFKNILNHGSIMTTEAFAKGSGYSMVYS